MPRQIQGSQTDFSFGEIDPALKRSDDHPARKGGLRQMSNGRILNARGIQNRSGRRAIYPVSNSGLRTERFTMSPGNVFDIQFAAGRVKIIDSTGTTVGNFTTKGGGGALPWASFNVKDIVYAILNRSIYITFGFAMRPQVISWNGVSTWSIADYTEQLVGDQKRTPFYRISAQNITLQPAGGVGVINVVASQAIFTAAHVGTRMRFVNRQFLITAIVGPPPSTTATVLVKETLPGKQLLSFATSPAAIFSLGDVVAGTVSGSKGIITNIVGLQMVVQLITQQTSATTQTTKSGTTTGPVYAFNSSDTVVGPGGSLTPTVVGPIDVPEPITFWDEEVMNDFQGYPASCFVDQFRLGFCNFPSVPGAIAWSAINSPTDLYVGVNPADSIFELAPKKVQVYYVVAGPEGSEFVFCDRGLYYIPISETNPLKPGSVAFKLLSGDGSAQVQPRVSQEAILYTNAGQSSMMAIIATGAQQRPFTARSLTEFHSHLFSSIIAIAAPTADDIFEERYAYVLNTNGSVVVGKYQPDSLQNNLPVIGWGPWSGGGAVSWVACHQSDVLFTSIYFATGGIVEVLDDAQYLDAALAVNALPAAFTAPVGKGPLWWIPSQSVVLIDQTTRFMGTYQIDADGFIIPQFNGGEDLTLLSLVAGQSWTMTTEPFAPDAQSGADMHQRMMKRRISNFAAYVVNSTGFTFQKLFSRKQTLTSPPLGTPVAIKRVGMWNVGQDTTLPPTQRETMESWRPSGHSFDPRVAIIKDTPGPLTIVEIGMEVTL